MVSTDLQVNGFAGPFPSFTPRRSIDALAEFFGNVLEDQPVHPLYGRYSLRDWHLVNDAVYAILTAPELIKTIAETTGADSLVLWRSKLFEKYPGDGAIDWHQEYGYFDGEEVGGHRPALYPFNSSGQWDWTMWMALTDVSEEDGVMEFVTASQQTAYPKRMVRLTESGAYVDPRNRVRTREELIHRAANNSLILDIDTRKAFDGVNTDAYSVDELFGILDKFCEQLFAAVTEPFEVAPGATRITPMKAGEYVIFTERCMHRSRASLPDAKMRLALNARYTVGDTWVYPQRATGDTFDGSNLDIKDHECVKVHGDSFCPLNVYR
ncbi:phytanoyl-CoA dioxygenase family protein [Streptomyces sp. DT24]|uniref:phytanoyl-CoA dioxygenase family protein n=1 Tax=Streptomyces sp. DT24 TaxID=3416520 RepID=UPI003CEC0FB7